MTYSIIKPKLIVLIFVLLSSCQGQEKKTSIHRPKIGGPCEGCEAIFEYGDKKLSAIDTLPGFATQEPKLKIGGVVFQKDGHTPAENVIIYIYHTNRQGIYETRGDEKNWGQKHGYHRAWVKTGRDGRYAFYTFRPAPYPDGREPEHIHLTIKEPYKNEYYIESIYFGDDPLLTAKERESLEKRGGSGIVELEKEKGQFYGRRDIILGFNIPDYD